MMILIGNELELALKKESDLDGSRGLSRNSAEVFSFAIWFRY
jgi:hypothetical protein